MKARLHRRRGSPRPRYLLLVTWLAVLVSGEEVFAQTISIFGNAVPNNAISSKNAVTLGVKFWSSQSGTISAIRFYRAVANSSGYVANLYTAGGTLLASAMLSRDTCSAPCWEVANFANPISISANTSYVAAYYSSAGAGASDAYGLSNGITNGPLTAPASSVVGGNGVYQHKNAFPSSSFEASNYYVDVLFTPTERSLVLNFNPPNPSIPASTPLGSMVAAIIPSWSDGSPFTGTLSFGPPYSNDQATFAISGNNLIVNPSGPGISADANTVQNVTIVASQ